MSIWRTEAGFGILWPRRGWLGMAILLGIGIGWLGNREICIFYSALVFFFLGLYTNVKRHEVTSKPFAFCLPGYRELFRRNDFIVGTLIGLALALWLFGEEGIRWEVYGSFPGSPSESSHPGAPQPVVACLTVASGFLAGMAVTVAIRVLGYSACWWVRGIASVCVVVCAPAAVIASTLDIPWFMLLPAWLAIGTFAWIRLGDMQYVGQGHRVLLNAESDWRLRIARVRGTRPRVETRFLDLMQGHGFLGLRRYCWGLLYENFAIMVSHPAWVIVLTGYVLIQKFVSEALVGFTFVVFGLLAINLHFPLAPRRILLLPAGRRERGVATGVTAIVASLMFAATGGVVVAASWLLWLVVQALPWEHVASAYSGINPTWFYWPCLLVPWVTASRLLQGWRARAVQGILVVVTLFLTIGARLFHTVPPWEIHAAYLGVFVCGWLLLLAALHVSLCTRDLG
mgnify:CR=1 FL=1